MRVGRTIEQKLKECIKLSGIEISLVEYPTFIIQELEEIIDRELLVKYMRRGMLIGGIPFVCIESNLMI